MNVLLVGSGGREHAIGWKLASSPRVASLASLPGNPGLAELGATIQGVEATDAGAIAALAAAQRFDLVVIGPEAPLAAGVADALRQAGIPVFGPSRAAARLESSKAFAKDVMDRAGVDTAAWQRFTELGPAIDHLRSSPPPYVVKADGLAGGKGVLVTEDRAAAEAWAADCLQGRFGGAGTTVVIEDFLDGPELSVFAVCDGRDAAMFEPARDYKRLRSGDEGPNTGGMGSYSPVDGLPADIVEFTRSRVVEPVLSTMAEGGHPFVGFLYTGFVLTDTGPKVLEFNCRLGDPETQVVLPRLRTDLVDIFEAALAGTVGRLRLDWADTSAVNVVLAAAGYPAEPRAGDRISGLDRVKTVDDVLIFHAGTANATGGNVVTRGGRVLNVVGMGTNVRSARRRAYEAVSMLTWNGMQFRPDIGEDTQ